MSRFEVHLLGGFGVRSEGRLITAFESQKVRALLIYLALGPHPELAASREHLAALLWPEEDQDTARKNLRQAVYNLRTALGPRRDPELPEPLLATHQSIQLNPAADWWLDVRDFEETANGARIARGGELEPHRLVRAARLYRGDLLPGFYVKDSPSFEDWLLARQERLRETAVHVFRQLADYYSTRGEYRLAIEYATRMVEIDPLSEAAHRELMRVYGLSGRRSAAIAQYQHLKGVLEEELGVEPLGETRQLYETILQQELQPAAGDEEPPIPFVPLVGRDAAHRQLSESWQAAIGGGGARLALVEGESGIGKTRLVKSFLNQASSQRRSAVLQGRCYDMSPGAALELLEGVVRNAIRSRIHRSDEDRSGLSSELLSQVALLLPELHSSHPNLQELPPLEHRKDLFEAIAEVLDLFLQPGEGEPADPLILFLDDLHLADSSSFELLAFLLERFAARPLWIVATAEPLGFEADHPARQLLAAASHSQRLDRLLLDRLDAAALDAVAESMVGGERCDELAWFLGVRTEGLPLAVTETINALCDSGLQVPTKERRWRLSASLDSISLTELASLEELILWRIRRLPNSTARLLTMGAVIGHRFDSELLQRAANEHVAVVETGLEVLLDRWLIRYSPHAWGEPVRERDLVLWAHGARRGDFEFAHSKIRRVVYESINPIRRQSMHRQVGEALEQLAAGETDRFSEELAYHFTRAGAWERAFAYLRIAAERSRALLADDTAKAFARRSLDVLEKLAIGSASSTDRERWKAERAELLSSWEELEHIEA